MSNHYNCNEATYFQESFAFYMSTNSFTNPIFNQSEAADEVQRPEAQPEAHAGGPPIAAKRSTKEFCDSIVLSVKSKIYILELNLKRKLRLIRQFTSRQFSRLFDGHAGHHLTARAKGKQHAQPLDGDEEFWAHLEPGTRETLGVQKERILSRLERVIEAKRSGQQYQQQQQHLFNMNRAELHNGQLLVRPLPRHTTSKSSSSLSSVSSSTRSSLLGSAAKPKHTSRRVKHRTRCNVVGDIETSAHSADANLCVICYSNPANILTLPCKHDEVCSDCFIELIYITVKHNDYPLKCVLCRQKIEKIRCSEAPQF